jgi:hypothetical protein
MPNDDETFTPDEIERVRSLNLRDEYVQGTLVGFVREGLAQNHGVRLPENAVRRLLKLYVVAIDRALDQAAEAFNEGKRP